jgi:hypothetical protein
MKARLSTLAALLIAAGASAAIAAAPAAVADPLLPNCEVTGAGGGIQGGENTECASPGNVQIDSTPPDPGAGMFPWDDEFWVL